MEIKNIYGEVIYTSKADTAKDAVLEAVKSRANLYGASLYGADLSRANLSGANLSGASLYGANLSGANLSGANLYGASLYGADLSRANLSGANLYGASLYGADLSRANLSGANLSGANLYGADLSGADLYGANLSGANLRELKNADLALAQIQFIPETGSFEAWKKCSGGVIVKLLIPADAKRSHGNGRKCRASKAEVLDVIGADTARSGGGYGIVTYRKGETVEPENGFDENRWEVCSRGIHFFLTRIEAENYEL